VIFFVTYGIKLIITLFSFLQMRVLKSDFAKYNVSDDEEMDDIGMR